MKIPIESFISSIKEQKIYYFSSDKINVDNPHYFICIKKTEQDILILTCCTSQFETIRRFVETRSLPYETLVWIKPNVEDDDNPFNVDTYVNCNFVFEYTIEEFRNMYNSNSISFSGEISMYYYSQIVNGLNLSPLIEEEIKDFLPKIDDL